jgi:hypothetical protein
MEFAASKGGAEAMTDYQFRSIMRMVLGLVDGKKTIEEIREAIITIIEDSEQKEEGTKGK